MRKVSGKRVKDGSERAWARERLKRQEGNSGLLQAVCSLSAQDRQRVLLLPDGGYYCGELERQRQNGLGAAWRRDGELQQCGRWVDGHLEEATRVPLCLVPVAVVAGKKCESSAASPLCRHHCSYRSTLECLHTLLTD